MCAARKATRTRQWSHVARSMSRLDGVSGDPWPARATAARAAGRSLSKALAADRGPQGNKWPPARESPPFRSPDGGLRRRFPPTHAESRAGSRQRGRLDLYGVGATSSGRRSGTDRSATPCGNPPSSRGHGSRPFPIPWTPRPRWETAEDRGKIVRTFEEPLPTHEGSLPPPARLIASFLDWKNRFSLSR